MVKQTCLAAWNATWNGSAAAPQAKADDGLGFPEQDTVTNAGPPETEQGQSGGSGPVGAYYSVQQNPGWEFSVTCNPTVSLSASSSANSGGGGSVQVVYSASASPVTIGLTGVITDSSGKSHVLVGQGVTAVLNAPLPSMGYSWSIQGGNPFKDYEVGKAGDAPSQPSQAVYTPLGAKDLALPTPHWYYAKPDTSTISCTALLVVPLGALPFFPLPVSVSTQCVVDGPMVAQPVITIGTMQLMTPVNGPLELWGALDPINHHQPFGTWWEEQVTTPDPYATQQGGGGWNFTQLVNVSVSITYQDNTTLNVTTNGAYWLDNTFGYAPEAPNTYSAAPVAPGKPAAPQENGDAPEIIFGHSAQTGSPCVSASLNDAFKTYVLYLPPGNDVKWVALWMWTWSCRGQADYDTLTGSWLLSNTNAQFQQPTAYPSQPTWNAIFGNH